VTIVLSALLLLGAARGPAATGPPPREAKPPEATARNAPAELTYFGTVAVLDGGLAVMDGGTHGVSGHTILLARDGSATWERRVDGSSRAGRAGSGAFRPSADERALLARWRERAWVAAGAGAARIFPDPSEGPPRWVWAIVQRRGKQLRVLEGAAIAPLHGTPEAVQEILEWLIRRVDALAAGGGK
jgi:hypothetical protein